MRVCNRSKLCGCNSNADTRVIKSLVNRILNIAYRGRTATAGFACGQAAVNEFFLVELYAVCHAVDFLHQLVNFVLDFSTVAFGVVGCCLVCGVVGGVYYQFTNSLYHVVNFLHSAFCGLNQGNTVLGVFIRHV